MSSWWGKMEGEAVNWLVPGEIRYADLRYFTGGAGG